MALLAHNNTLVVNDLFFKGLGDSKEELEIMATIASGSHADVAITLTPHLSKSTNRSSARYRKKFEQSSAKGRAEVELLPVDGLAKGKGVNWSSPFATIPISHNTTNFSSQFGAFQSPHLRPSLRLLESKLQAICQF